MSRTKIKIHLQPLSHTTLMCPIPHARIPPKAPAREAALKKREMRNCLSRRLYLRSLGQNRIILKLPSYCNLPHREVVHHSREETALSDTEEKAGNKESGHVGHDSHERRDNSPCDGQCRKPEAWSGSFQNDVAWDLQRLAMHERVSLRNVVVIAPTSKRT